MTSGESTPRPLGAGPLVGLALVVAIALVLRTAPAYEAVAGGDLIRLQGADAWHHLRQIEQWVRHFPQRMSFDAFALHPDGQGAAVAPLFDLVATLAALVAGWGRPSERTIALVAAWLPPILGALTCLPAFALGRRAGGTAGGLIAASATAVLPGQFLDRTRLGFADHHALEALLAPLVVLALARATSASDARRAALAAVGAGIVLLLYLMTWTGGALLVLILAAWCVIQINADHAQNRAQHDGGARAGAVGAALFATALLGHLLVGGGVAFREFARTALAAGLVTSAALGALARALHTRRMSRVHLPMATLAIGAGATLLVGSVAPELLRRGWHALMWFAGTGLQTTVGEAAPLLIPDGDFTLAMAWTHFGTALPLAICGLATVGLRAFRTGRAELVLIVVWSAAMLLATLGQNRFGYYFAICAAVLVGGLLGPPLGRLWRGETSEPLPIWLRRGLWPTAALLAVVLPVAPVTLRVAAHESGPSDAWIETLTTLREQTPAPFGDDDVYDELLDAPRGDGYGVLAWWDAGYWMTAIAHRVPVANPTQAGAGRAARWLLAAEPGAAAREFRDADVRYVIVDGELPLLPSGKNELTGELGQVARWADLDSEDYYRTYHHRAPDGRLQPIILFEPAYYETLAMRLFLYGGQAAEPSRSTSVVVWRDVDEGAGRRWREIVSLERFPDYGRALKALRRLVTRGEENARLVGQDATATCVPLLPADDFERVHASNEIAASRTIVPLPAVQVYAVRPSSR